MPGDFVKELVTLLQSTPQTAWEITIRARFGAADHYIHRRGPEERQAIKHLQENNVDPRKARRFVRGY